MPVMRCPYCRKVNTELFDGKRERERGTVRMRICKECGRKFSTIEKYSKQTLQEAKII